MLLYLGLAGILVTLYAIYVEKTPGKALCDVGEHMSCTRVLKSPYAKMVGKMLGLGPKHPLNLPNTYFGIMFYLTVCLCAFFHFYHLLLILSIVSMIASFGLAYILYFKLQDFCLVCVTTYVINSFILYFVSIQMKL